MISIMEKPATQKRRSFSKRISLKYHYLRFRILKYILKNVRLIRGHLVLFRDLNQDSIVVDLGANTGSFSFEISKAIRNTCYAVEPVFESFSKINQENVVALNYAISNIDMPVDLFISNNPEASSVIHNFENRWGQIKKIKVEGITFKTLLNKLKIENKVIDILKIDIEGAELEFIDSLTEDVVKNVKQITIEFHDWLDEKLCERTDSAINKLMAFGFDAYSYGYRDLRPVEMLFLNKKMVKFNIKEKLCLSTCESIPYPYPIIRRFKARKNK